MWLARYLKEEAQQMNFRRVVGLMLVAIVSACSINQEHQVVQKPSGNWTLEFTWLKNDKPVKIQSYEYASRGECFNAMYTMQQEAKKVRSQSGAGLCYKAFSDGQERTANDVLARYR
jgi:hypothetical protein